MSGGIGISDPVFLRSDARIEPLVCGWYAWSYLISPVQHAMNVAFRQIPLLKSFISNPRVHVTASRDPALFGGPFVSLSDANLPILRQLLDETVRQCSRSICLANDIRRLDCELQQSAHGFSLEENYARLPESLRGLVELIYDTNNHPKIRFYEELVYEENLAADSTEIMLSLVSDDDRPFFMSTPRIRTATTQSHSIPFDHPGIDVVSEMRTRSKPFGAALKALGIEADQAREFAGFFTHRPPLRDHYEYTGDGVRLRYFGHACVLIQTRDTSILLDPLISWQRSEQDQRLAFADLPDHLDYVVLSHNHQDHCVPEVLIQLRHRIGRVAVPENNSGSIVDPSMKLMLRKLGFHNLIVLNAFDEVQIPGGAITSLPFPGEHVDLDICSRHGIHIRLKGRTFAFLVDADGRDPYLYQRIARKIGRRLDALFIGMECHGAPLSWLYGPLLATSISRRDDESRRLSGLNCERAWRVLQEFDTSRVFVYAMGQEPWLKYIMGLQYSSDSLQMREVSDFLGRCKRAGIEAEHLFIRHEQEFPALSSQ